MAASASTYLVLISQVVSAPSAMTMTQQVSLARAVVAAHGAPVGGEAPRPTLLLGGWMTGDASAIVPEASALALGTAVRPGVGPEPQVRFHDDHAARGQDRDLVVSAVPVNGRSASASGAQSPDAAGRPGDDDGSGDQFGNGAAEFRPPASDPPAETSDPAAVPAPALEPSAQRAPAFHVATDGSDAGDGSSDHPFASLDRARAAMEAGTTRTTYLRGGTYSLGTTLMLGSAASGTAFLAEPGQEPVLDGSAAQLGTIISVNDAHGVTISGLSFTNAASGSAALSLSNTSGSWIIGNLFKQNDVAILLNGSSRNIVAGNEIQESAQTAIEVKDESNFNIFDSNIINHVGGLATHGGGFFLHGASHNVISHNEIENTAGMGIGINNWDDQTINVSNTIMYNIVRNANLRSEDSGAIYILGRSQVNTRATISNNLIDGTGASGEAHTIGIYLDDSTSGVEVRDNILRGIGTHGVEVHGGDDNLIRNNIFDLGSRATSAVLFQSAPADTNPRNTMLNNEFSGNIIYGSGVAQTPYSHITGGHPTIAGNLYHSASGCTLVPAAPTADTSPRFGDPKFLDAPAGNYALQPGSAANQIGFQQIDQGLIGLRPTTAHWYALPQEAGRPARER